MVRNVLTVLTIGVILAWTPVVALVLNNWGWEPGTRIALIGGFGGLTTVTLIAVIILSMQEKEPLYPPTERVYGTAAQPLERKEIQGLPTQPPPEGKQ